MLFVHGSASRFPPLPVLLLLAAAALAASLAGCDAAGPGGSTTFPPPVADFQKFPRWSPDGERILYYDEGLIRYDPETRLAEHDYSRRGLWTMAPDGSDQRQVLAGASLYGDWSPGGDSLVFEAGGGIYKAAFEDGVVDTASIVRLSPPGRRCFFPDWSPDGKQIAYDNTNCGSTVNPTPDSCGIFTVMTNGTETRRIIGRADWFLYQLPKQVAGISVLARKSSHSEKQSFRML